MPGSGPGRPGRTGIVLSRPRTKRLEPRKPPVAWVLVGTCLLTSGAVDVIAADSAAPAGPVAGAATPATPEPRFTVQEYRVIGNSVLQSRDIETVLYPLLGENKQFADVESARTALEKAYHDKGFGTVFVDIPPQEIKDGIVRLHVTEAKLNERKIEGARYFSEREIAAAVPAAKVGTVPSLTDLQVQLAAVNSQTPDRSVVPVLKAGPVPGTLDLDLQVTDHLPLHGSLEVNDYYSTSTKPLRATASLSYADLFAALDTIGLQYQWSPQAPSQVGVIDATYGSRPFWGGYRLSGYFIDSDSDLAISDTSAGATVAGSTGLIGKGQIAGLRFSAPPIITSEVSHVLTLGVDYKHFRNVINQGGAPESTGSPGAAGSATSVTPITYTNLSLSYSGALRLTYFEGALTVGPNFGLRTGGGGASAFENDRFLARPNYSFLRYDGSLTYKGPAGFRLTARVAGQATNEPLISNENFSIAGSDGVRGYLEAEELGDSAIKGTLQLQSPDFSWGMQKLFNAFAFFDAGRSRIFDALKDANDPTKDQPDHAQLESWGLGLSLLPGGPVTGLFMWADPLKNGSYTLAHQSRFLFSVRGSF